jgi:23S rRNA (uridine2552-2'-O)-methyltransferase
MTLYRRFKGSITSTSQWHNRQSTDKFVNLKSKYNYRARSAFKLQEIQSKFNIIKTNSKVLDLGCSPGNNVLTRWLVSGCTRNY